MEKHLNIPNIALVQDAEVFVVMLFPAEEQTQQELLCDSRGN